MVENHSPSLWEVLVDKFPQQAQTPRHYLARALGIKMAEADAVLKQPAIAENLLRVHAMAVYRYLALVNRVWPHCPWWEDRTSARSLHPVLHLWSQAFGHDLLVYVEQHFGLDKVLEYWRDLVVPDAYRDFQVDPATEDPLQDIPEDQLVWNPHQADDDEIQLFIFGSPTTAACFRWLIATQNNYGLYVGNRTGYVNDPLGLQLAYDLRRSLKDNYWATLPPDTLPTYLALAQALYDAEVPAAFQDGPLAELSMRKVATLNTSRLEVVQVDWDSFRWSRHDALHFEAEPVNVYVLESDTDQSPAAVILTTNGYPGNPEHHRKLGPVHQMDDSDDTMVVAFVPQEYAQERLDLDDIEDIVEETLFGTSYGLDIESQIFCIVRINPGFVEDVVGPIRVYSIPGGYMLQFNPTYSFTPNEMEPAEDFEQ